MSPRMEHLLNKLLLWSLVLWGGYSGVFFIQSHLFPIFPEQVAEIMASSSRSPFLQGLTGLLRLPFHSQGGFLIAAGLAVFLAVFFLEKRGIRLPRVALTPARVLLGSIGLLFIIFLAVYGTPLFGQSRSLIFRPTSDVYRGATPEILAVIGENVDVLRARGCIRQETSAGVVLGRYQMKCLMGSFVTRVLPSLLFLALLVLDLLLLGRFVLRRFRLSSSSHTLDAGIAMLLGAGVLVIALWVAAVLRIATAPVVALLSFAPLLLLLHEIGSLKTLLKQQWTVPLSLDSLLTFLLVLLLSLNFLTVLRPFPIGWDDLTQYLAAPKAFAEMGRTVPGMDRFQWEYLASIPYILFGPESPLGAQGAQAVLWLGSALAVLLLFAFSRVFVSKNAGVLAALFYLSIPMMGHASFTELKTEGALFALSVGAVAALLIGLNTSRGRTSPPAGLLRFDLALRWIAVAGALAGFAFGVKFTSVLLLSLLLVLLSFHSLGLLGAAAAALLPLGAFALLSGKNIGLGSDFFFLPAQWVSPAILVRTGAVLLVGCAALFILSFLWRRQAGKTFLVRIGVFAAGMLVISSPWLMRNVLSWGLPREARSAKWGDISPAHLFEARDTVRPVIWYSDLPSDFALDLTHPACVGTAAEESFSRYQWPQGGVKAMISAPWHLVMNTFTKGFYVTLSPLLLLLPLVLLLASFWRERWLQGLILGTLLVIVEWFLVARGIPWYGAIVLFPVALLVEMMCRHDKQMIRVTVGILTLVAITTAFAMRAAQFSVRSETYEYMLGKVSKAAAQELTFPGFSQVSEHVQKLAMEKPDRPYLYRVGAPLPYFLKGSLETVGRTDNRLDFFTCLNQEQDHRLTLRRLQNLGFSSIIFDTTAADIEPDPTGTLHQKMQEFQAFLRDPALPLELVVDRPDWGYVFVVLP